jgi:hypothetical protein
MNSSMTLSLRLSKSYCTAVRRGRRRHVRDRAASSTRITDAGLFKISRYWEAPHVKETARTLGP